MEFAPSRLSPTLVSPDSGGPWRRRKPVPDPPLLEARLDYLLRQRSLGAIAVFSKPVAPEELLEAVEKALSSR